MIDGTLFAFSLAFIFYTFVCFIFMALGSFFFWSYSDQGEKDVKRILVGYTFGGLFVARSWICW